MSLFRLRSIGMMQKTFMWKISIPNIPNKGANNIEFLARSITIPGKTKSKDQIRYLNDFFNQPSGTSFDGEATISILLDETHTSYDDVINWYDYTDFISNKLGVESAKTDVNISLLGLDKTTVNKRFQYLGCFPLVKPEISGLTQDDTEGFITFDLNLAVDDVNFDANNLLTF